MGRGGRLPERSGEAIRHYELFDQDFILAQKLSHNAHRFSIEWSRIESREGAFDENAIRHYHQVIDSLISKNITPIVTLHHFVNPLWFAQKGGWLDPDLRDHSPVTRRKSLTLTKTRCVIGLRSMNRLSWRIMVICLGNGRRAEVLCPLPSKFCATVEDAHRRAYQVIHARQKDLLSASRIICGPLKFARERRMYSVRSMFWRGSISSIGIFWSGSKRNRILSGSIITNRNLSATTARTAWDLGG